MYFLLLLIGLVSPLFGIDPTIEVHVNPISIGTNETAEIRIDIINDQPSDIPTLSTNLDTFSISYSGNSVQKELNIINGNVDVKNIYSYVYRLIPKKTGSIKIPTFKITTSKGNIIYSAPSSITVQNTATVNAPQRNQSNNPFGFLFEEPTEVFLRWHVTQNTLTQNTGMIVYLYFFSNDPNFLNNIPSLQQMYPPRFDGGLIHGLSSNPNPEIVTEQFGHQTFYGRVIAQYLIFPLEKGTLYLHPPVYTGGSRFQQFNVVGDPIEIHSVPITDTLTYIGDILDISVVLSSNVLVASEEQTLTISLEGDGNVDFFVDPFKNTKLEDLFISSPTSTLELGVQDENNSNQLYMKKTFTYTVIPKKEGTYTIPALDLSFATTSGKATNALSDPIKFKVLPQENLAPTKNDLIFYPNNPQSFSYHSGLLFIILAFLLGSTMMIVSKIYSKKQQKLANDFSFARAVGAKKRLAHILAQSEKALENSQYKDASRLIRQSILYFCADKFTLSNSSSPQEILNFFVQNHIVFPTQNRFIDLMQELEFNAFANTPNPTQIKEYLSEAYMVLDDISKVKIKS